MSRFFGWRRRIDRTVLGVERPPTVRVPEDHPALDGVQPRVLDGFLGRVEDDWVTHDTENGRGRVKQDHAVT